MRRILKYLKPYAVLVIAAVILLFGQAYCDLSLPNYMSKIVDTGIQQGGIESAAPQEVSEGTMDTLKGFMEEDQKPLVEASYTLVSKDSADYDTYLKKYPALENENIYVENQVDEQTQLELGAIFARPFASVSAIGQVIEAQQSGLDTIALDKQQNVDGTEKTTEIPPAIMQFMMYYTQQPEGTDFFAALNTYPDAGQVYRALNELLDEKLNGMDASMLQQMAIPAVRGGILGAGDGYYGDPAELHMEQWRPDASSGAGQRGLYRCRRLACRQSGRGRCARPAGADIYQGGELFQCGI